MDLQPSIGMHLGECPLASMSVHTHGVDAGNLFTGMSVFPRPKVQEEGKDL